MIQLSRRAPACTRQLGDRPRATRLARCQAANGALVTNLRHTAIRLPDLDRRVLGQLDGERRIAEIGEQLRPWWSEGPGRTGSDPESRDIGSAVAQSLDRIASNAFLVASKPSV